MGLEKIVLLGSKRLNRCLVGGLLVLWVALSFSPALVEISFVFSLVLFMIIRLRHGTFLTKSLTLALVWPLWAYAGVSVASYFWSEFPQQSFRGVFKVLQQLCLFLMAAEAFRAHDNRRYFELVFLGAFSLLIANGFFQFFYGRDLIRGFPLSPASAGVRVTAAFKSYGLFATYLISTIPFLGALGWRYWKREGNFFKCFLCFLMLFGGLVMLFLTRSRGAVLALGLGTLFLLLMKRKWVLSFALVLLFGGSLFFLPKQMVIHVNYEGGEQSLVERYYLWDRALQVIRAKPWGGTGINTYASAHQKYDKTQSWRVKNYYAHNGYLQLAAETGLPSLCLFLWFLGSYFYHGFRKVEEGFTDGLRLGLLAGILNFLIFASVDTVLHNASSATTFWFLLGLQLTYRKTRLEESPPSLEPDLSARKAA